MSLTPFELFVWAAGFCGQAALLAVLFLRRRTRTFPFFTIFIAYEMASTAIQYFAYRSHSARLYTYTNWSLGIVDEVLQLLVFYEVALQVFRPIGAWAPDVRRTFISFIGISSVLALALAWLAQPATHHPTETFILRTDFFSSLLMSELFVVSLALSVTCGLPWKTHVARIAQGLGAFSIISLAAYIAKIAIGLDPHLRTYRLALNHFISCTYFLCETYWVVMLWADAPAPRELPPAMRNQIFILQRQVENDLMRIRSWRRN